MQSDQKKENEPKKLPPLGSDLPLPEWYKHYKKWIGVPVQQTQPTQPYVGEIEPVRRV